MATTPELSILIHSKEMEQATWAKIKIFELDTQTHISLIVAQGPIPHLL